MSLISPKGARSILLGASVYFALCGLSAIFWPVSWLWASGLPTTLSPVLTVLFQVLGVYLCALAAGSLIACKSPQVNSGLILTLALANAFDFIATLGSLIRGDLPALNGGLFLAVSMIWTTLLALVWLQAQEKTPQHHS
jgi:hypothetical protein